MKYANSEMWFSMVKISWKNLLSYSFVQGRISKISWNQEISYFLKNHISANLMSQSFKY